MAVSSVKRNYLNNSRNVYQNMFMSIVFSLRTGHEYDYVLRKTIHIFIFIWMLTVSDICIPIMKL